MRLHGTRGSVSVLTRCTLVAEQQCADKPYKSVLALCAESYCIAVCYDEAFRVASWPACARPRSLGRRAGRDRCVGVASR